MCDIGEQEEFVPAHQGRIRKAQSKQMRLTSLEDPWRKNLPPHNKPTGRKNRKLIKQVDQVSRQSLARDNKHKVRRFLNYLPRLPLRPLGKVVFESSPAFISVLIATCLWVWVYGGIRPIFFRRDPPLFQAGGRQVLGKRTVIASLGITATR